MLNPQKGSVNNTPFNKVESTKIFDSEQYPILLVEDNPDDILITQRAWKKGLIKNRLYVVNDGEQALEFIYKKGEFTDAPTPSLMLLDLNMPKVDGFEVLKTVKQDKNLKKMPIVVLTSSRDNTALDRAFDLGCNSFIVKPVGYDNFLEAVIDIQRYWIQISEIPPRL
jgi:CheY-like chemotaxis protein